MKTLGLFLIVFFTASSAFADTSMKAHVVLVGETQSWLSGAKRRMETKLPLAGKIVTITRVDRSVEWILNPDKKIYQERPIALSYEPSKNSDSNGSENQNADQNQNSDDRDSSEEKNDCVPELHRVSEIKVIAGYKATGFSAACGNGPSQGMIWMAPPLGRLASVSNEWAAYYHQHAAALYANFPSAQRGELISSTEKFGDILKDLLISRLGHPTKFPQGVMMAVEGKFSNNGTGPSKTVYEVKEILEGPVDPNLFEIPAGYQKVPDLTKALLQSGLQNFQQMFEIGKKFFVQSGAQGNPLQGAIEWAKKAYDDFMANQTKK